MDDPIDKICLDVPLLIRLLELAREDIKTDAQLHELVERITSASKTVPILGMEQYAAIVGQDTPAMAAFKALARLKGSPPVSRHTR